MFLCDKGITMPQTKFGLFLVLKYSVWPFSGLWSALFGFLLKFSSGNPNWNVRALSHKVNRGCSVQRRTNINNLTASKRATMYCLTFSIVQEIGTHFFAISRQRYERYIEPDDY